MAYVQGTVFYILNVEGTGIHLIFLFILGLIVLCHEPVWRSFSIHLWTDFPISRAESCYHEDEICSFSSEVIPSVLCHSEQRRSQAEVRQKSHLHLRLFFPNMSFHKNLLF